MKQTMSATPLHLADHSPSRFTMLAERDAGSGRREYDGIICFGAEDWWYHNRGHYDLQMMREFSRDLPVLYINSIGVRLPRAREGRMCLRRIARKLGSLHRGLVHVREHFAVLSPVVVPGAIGSRLTGPFLAPQVRRAARRLGILRPLVWVACPPAAVAIDRLGAAAIVYQRTDRHECFAAETHDRVSRCDRWLKARADLTVFCSNFLRKQEQDQCRRPCLVDHGVDFERFAGAAAAGDAAPPDMRALPRPRVGFVGGIDAHTFDPELFLATARALDDAQFVLVGGCSLPDGWCDLPNVAMLGQKPYEQVAAYMAACDVLIMPWNRSPWIEACNPIKLREYLAVGRPIVSTKFAELERYRGHVRVADTAEAFAQAIRWALDVEGDLIAGRELVRHETWANRAAMMREELRSIGVVPRGSGGLVRTVRQSASRRVTDGADSAHEIREPVRLSPSPDVLAVIGRGGAHGEPIRLRLVSDVDRRRDERSGAPAVDVAACVILAGGLTPSPLAQQADRSVLDLSLSSSRTVLERWIELVRELPGAANAAIRVIHDGRTPAPAMPAHVSDGDEVSIEREPRGWRGPAGVLRDVSRQYDADAPLLVMEGARCCYVSPAGIVADHVDRKSDVTVGVNADRSPAGIYVIRAGALASVADLGYVDLKEQWLKNLGEGGGAVHVHVMADGLGGSASAAPASMPIRTLEQHLASARALRARQAGVDVPPPASGLIRDGAAQPLRVICPGALVGPGAVVIDSIVMAGAIVPPDATIVRSLICPRTRIQAGADIADAVVSAPARLSDHG